jgi:hypothetical protein
MSGTGISGTFTTVLAVQYRIQYVVKEPTH